MQWCFYLALVLGWSAAGAERELIQDHAFRRGFILWETKPGRHVRYGELKGFATNLAPVWGLSQWSSRFPLDPATAVHTSEFVVGSNSAKAIKITGPSGISMAVNSAVEYEARTRVAQDPWVHLLVEQEFDAPPSLARLTSAPFHVEARLLRSRNLHVGDYSPAVHAAQFQIFFTVQNRNRQSPGYGDLLWFGIPLYDNRDRVPKGFKAQDFGGTAKFIFTPAGRTFTTQSAHEGTWLVIDQDLQPLLREALATAWGQGFLKGSKAEADYSISGMNMGWELPGNFDVEMQVRALSLKVALDEQPTVKPTEKLEQK